MSSTGVGGRLRGFTKGRRGGSIRILTTYRMTPGLAIITETGSIAVLNDAVCQLLAVDRDHVIGQPWTQLLERVEPTGVALIRKAFDSLIAGQESQHETVVTLQGRQKHDAEFATMRWTLSSVNGKDSMRGVCLILEECRTGMSKAVANIVVRSYRDVFDHAVEGMFRTSLDGAYIEVNASLARLYGYQNPSELVRSLRDIYTQLYVDPTRRAQFTRLLAMEGVVKDFESEVYRMDGSRIWISEHARTVFDESGYPMYYEGSVVDITGRRLAETRLRESERRYRLLVEAMNLVPWEADFSMRRFRYVGPQAASFLGFPVETWLEPGFWIGRVHPDDREWVELVRDESVEKKGSFEMEYRMIRVDGRVVWVRDMMRAVSDNNGGFLSGCMLDVTYRRHTEASLQQSQQFFEHVVNASPVILYVYDLASTRCIYINGRAGEILGYTADSLCEMEPLFLISLAHPDELDAREEHMRQLQDLQGEEVVTSEFRVRAADGRWVWLRIRESLLSPASNGESSRVVGTAIDGTGQRLAFDELVNNEKLFRQLAESTRAIPFEYEPQSDRFSYVGPQAPALLGHPLSSWYRQGFWNSIIHPDDRKRGVTFSGSGERSAATSRQTEFRLLKTDGRYLWVSQVVRRAVDEDDRIRVRGFILDVTESKKREEELSRSRAMLKELTEQIQEAREQERVHIARELHDELGQTLTLFQIELQWLENGLKQHGLNDPQIEEKLAELKGWSGDTLQTVRRLLARLRPPVLDELGLAAALQWQVEEFSRRAGMRCELVGESFDCHNKQTAIVTFRVFQELLTNTAKHAKATHIKINVKRCAEHLVIAVSDNGRGFQSPPSGKQTGFGLLGIRERLEPLEGRLAIVSPLGGGTTVTIEIPLSKLD